MAINSTIYRLMSPSPSVSKTSIYADIFLLLKTRVLPTSTPLFFSPKSFLCTTPNSAIITFSLDSLDVTKKKNYCFPGSLIPITPRSIYLPPKTDPSILKSNIKMLLGSNILLSDFATDAKVSEAEYVTSSPGIEFCPKEPLPEFALIGRSNVGKSSLLNCIVNHRKVAKISKKAGRTRLINHFIVNKSWFLVDLPGYGYARTLRKERDKWVEFTKDYILRRKTLICVFLLIDASVPIKKTDLKYARWLNDNKIEMTLVFTKCEKKWKTGERSPGELVTKFVEMISVEFGRVVPWIMTSSATNFGGRELQLHIAQLRNFWLHH